MPDDDLDSLTLTEQRLVGLRAAYDALPLFRQLNEDVALRWHRLAYGLVTSLRAGREPCTSDACGARVIAYGAIYDVVEIGHRKFGRPLPDERLLKAAKAAMYAAMACEATHLGGEVEFVRRAVAAGRAVRTTIA